ncbi:hypothetical protein Nepgr_031507 [Nepenthes gracilis]|uniref:Uncharacterized protein n=1 Tax=Nepenthes gracilis TaxID=150966 RepID=A0AAD3TIA5_NEPGR|nr:hypothetical protein Nepgr_031507 [Nepenthes gracilis]
MMSIFSSFDALSLESLGRKFSVSTPSALDRKGLSSIDDSMNDSSSHKKEIGARISGSWTDQNQIRREQPSKIPRFAIELDGVHCFETIVPF